MSANSPPKDARPAATPAGSDRTESEPVQLEFDTSAAATGDMPAGSSSLAGGPEAKGGVGALVERVRASSAHLMQTAKPWSEVFDRTAFTKPATVGDVTTRIQKNLTLYRTNYFVFFLATMALSFLTQPRALLWTGALLAAWVYLFLIRTAPLVIGGREYSEREKALGLGLLSFVVVFFLSPVGATALYGASLSACLIAVHASFREPDDLFLDDPGPAHLFGNGGAPMGSVFAGLSSQPASSGAGAIV